ncbi:polymerase delta-interacting protein 3-like isoform X1 [Onthophagus taurus]|uniref:polymerase delta-interacting protein 3-like isoform X1 n=1 Tax=Onthophagus taurus TaxID=166361 RepID=UPI0039BDB8D6
MVKARNRINMKPSQNIKKRLGTFKIKPNVADARQKLIQSKRKNVRDARDILANMAKKQDARNKLEKMRQKRSGDVKYIGNSIMKKTDRNGKISLVTNKPKLNDLNVAIQQQLGLLQSRSPKKISPKRPIPSVKQPFVPPVIRKTILNDYTLPVQTYPFDQSDLYRWVHPDIIPQTSEPRRNYNPSDLRFNSKRLAGYVDLDAVDDEEMPLVAPLRTTPMKMSIHSRLDTLPAPQQSHGVLASGIKTKVVIPVGHRIVVSNLQGGVTEDDIRELFEDIGELLVARLVRPGTAEVIYKDLKDAQKAVETYHNRQLDGQPMKCLLVNKRPINNPTAPAIAPVGSVSRKSTISDSNKLVPDLSTIHKVLFQRD